MRSWLNATQKRMAAVLAPLTLADGAAYLLIFLYAAFFSFLSIRRHLALQSYGYDLGIFDQVIWNTAHGRWFLNTVMEDSPSFIGHHYAPLLALLAPLYWLWDSVNVILIAQSLALALGAAPIYWLARERLGGWAGVGFAAAYLLFPPLEAGNLFDFHEVALAVPLLAFAVWFLVKRNNAGFAVCAILAMQAKEDIPLSIAIMGLYALVIQRRVKFGLAWIAGSAAMFALAVYVIIPHAFQGSTHPFLSYYSDFGQTPLQIAWNLVSNPAHTLQFLGPDRSIAYLWNLIAPFGLWPLLAPFELLLFLPTLLINLLSNYTPMHRLALQYPLALVPFLGMSSVLGASYAVKWLTGRRVPQAWAVTAVTIVALIGALAAQREDGLTPLGRNFTDYPASPHAARLAQFLSLIPPGASVSAQPNLLPHLTHREQAHMFASIDDAEYVVLDAATGLNLDNINGWVQTDLMRNYHIAAAEDGYLLLQRGAGMTVLPPGFFTFARSDGQAIQHKVAAQFGEAIDLLGYDVDYHEWDVADEPQFVLYLRARRPLDRNYLVETYLIDEKGEVAGSANWPQTTQVWYPTSEWQPGEIIALRVNTTTWWTGSRSRFAIALGIVEGDDPWDVGARLVPHDIQSPYVIALPGERTLLQFATFTNDLVARRQFAPQPHLFALPSGVTGLDAAFGPAIVLRGYSWKWTANDKRARVLDLSLYWQSHAPVDRSYTVFTHLLDAKGQLLSQHDGIPNFGRTPTDVWLKDEVIADEHLLQLDGHPSGTATLEVGLYDSESGNRLPVQGEAGGGDALKFQIPPP